MNAVEWTINSAFSEACVLCQR